MTVIRQRITLETGGWADAEVGVAGSLVRVGDRLVPRAIDATFPSVGGQPGLTMRLEVVDGRPQCRQLSITATDAGREVKQLDLRAIELARMVEDWFSLFALEVVSDEGGEVAARLTDDLKVRAAAVAELQRARKGRTHRKITPGFLLDVATTYLANIDTNPTEAVAAAFGVSSRQAGNYLGHAEEAGLLSAAGRGRKREQGPEYPG